MSISEIISENAPAVFDSNRKIQALHPRWDAGLLAFFHFAPRWRLTFGLGFWKGAVSAHLGEAVR
jgi:hypothetical protein